MPKKAGAKNKKGKGLSQSGNALRQSGNRVRRQRGKGPFSDFLKKIPLIGGPLGGMASMVGMGRRPHQMGQGPWGDILTEVIHKAGQQGINDLSNLTRKL